ncbi:MAG: hypothetical protein A2Z20_06080 [Bdellovibrionales bacterium RBG_16_40_8]|nr:MAG: hypothetical protein A2Z20_06080 [Bdellovibrionales bacterium RBG_16_40_8]
MKAIYVAVIIACAASLFGCAHYGGIAPVGKGKVVILRNDVLLFGLLRKALVCDTSSEGVSNCKESEQP